MTVLNADELRFLRHYGFEEDDVHDGRFQTKRRRKAEAKDTGKTFILGTRCGAGGHRLRTRSGHCVQCDPKKIAFQQRHTSPGYVYIAGTLTGRLIKIGTAKSIPQRESQLRAERHAGFRDWAVLFLVKVAEGGKIEHAASARVQGKRRYLPYWKDGIEQTATEVIECSFSAAFEAITATLGDMTGRETGKAFIAEIRVRILINGWHRRDRGFITKDESHGSCRHPGRLLKRELSARKLSANRLSLDIAVPSGRTPIFSTDAARSPPTRRCGLGAISATPRSSGSICRGSTTSRWWSGTRAERSRGA